jgi:Bax protein
MNMPPKSHPYIIAGLVLVLVGVAFGVLRSDVPDFSQYPAGKERKEAFFDYFLPLIKERNQEILEQRQQLNHWYEERQQLGWWDAWQVEDLAQEYLIKDFDINSDSDWNTLLKRVDIVPPSLALAQAAKESAWGTSRFARQGYNFFGQWCYQPGCGLIPNDRGDGKRHEVADFDSPEASVDSYIQNLNSHNAYHTLRNIRARLRAQNQPITGLALSEGLGSYSERGEIYIEELRSMMSYNELYQYDSNPASAVD